MILLIVVYKKNKRMTEINYCLLSKKENEQN